MLYRCSKVQQQLLFQKEAHMHDAHRALQVASGAAPLFNWRAGGKFSGFFVAITMLVIAVAPSTSSAQTLAAGAFHNCTLSTTGGVVCWGVNDSGQIGDNSTITRTKPVNVTGAGFNSQSLAGGFQHTCAVGSNGAVKCWGKNDKGQIGDSSITTRLLPTAVDGLSGGYTAVAAGDLHSCALSTGGGVKCWGYNIDGQVGDSSFTERHAPVDVSGLGSGITAIAAGYNHTCAVTTTGAAKCWGTNEWWQLGDGTEDFNANAPVDVVGLSSGVTAIAGGNLHTCALVSGGVKCWGYNNAGAIGDGTNTLRKTPVNVSGLSTGVISVTAGSAHSCALTSGGSVKCWGDNAFGQLGDGTNTSSNIPVTAIASGAIAVAAGAAHTCALLSPGNSVCWGNNPTGQLGNGTIGGQSYVPVSSQFPTSTTTTIGTSGTPSVFGDAVTFTATVTGGTNGAAVAFQNAGISIAGCGSQALSGGSATCSTTVLPVGTHSIAAIYLGDANTQASSSTTLSQLVNKADQVITFDALADKVDNDDDFSAIASTSSGLVVTFSSLTAAVCTVSSSTVDILTAGVCTIAANQAGNSNFNAAPQVTQSFTIASSGPALALTAVVSRKTHGAAGTFEIPINTSVAIGGAVSVESRTIGSGHRIVFQYNIPITSSGTATVIDAMATPFGSTVTFSGNEVVVTIPMVPNNKRLTVSLNNVNASGGTQSASVGFLVGDASNDRAVNVIDVNAARARSGQPVTATNFRFDFDASGSINVIDVNAVRARSGTTLL
jgi:trimeric autotransporter adhesin